MNSTQGIALYAAREATVRKIGDLARSWDSRISDLRRKWAENWVRGEVERGGPTAMGSPAMFRRVLVSPIFSSASRFRREVSEIVLDRLKEMERLVYDVETRNVADALHESTPDWIEVTPDFDEDETTRAQEVIINDVPQEAAVAKIVDELLHRLQGTAARRARAGSTWDGILGAMESSFEVFEFELRGITVQALIYAANVAKDAANRSLRDGATGAIAGHGP